MTIAQEEYEQLPPEGKQLADVFRAIEANDVSTKNRLMQEIVFPAKALMALKRARGAQAIRDRNLNTIEADLKYGKDWLDK